MTYLAKTAAILGLTVAAGPALAQSDDISESTLTCGEFIELSTADKLEVTRNVDFMGASDAVSDDEIVDTTENDVQALVAACDGNEALYVNDVAGDI